MESIMVSLDPRVTTDESSPGHIVGLSKPGQVFVLERAEVRTMGWDVAGTSTASLFLLKQNPADYPVLDHPGNAGVEETALTRHFSPLAHFTWATEGPVGDVGVKRYEDIDYPLVGGLLGLYHISGINFTALTYMLALRGHYRKFRGLEAVQDALVRRRGWTEMVNHVGVNWDVHLPR